MIKVQKLRANAVMPSRANPYDAGLDLASVHGAVVPPNGGSVCVPTGLAIELEPGTVGLIWPRSKLSTRYKSLVLGGVIDAGYRGEVMISLINHSDEPIIIKPGDKIAQLVVQDVFLAEVMEVDELTPTERDIKGINDRHQRII